MKNGVQFKIKSLNQEKKLNILLKTCHLYDVVRESKAISVFRCSLFHAKKVRKKLKELDIEIVEEKNVGFFSFMLRSLNVYVLSAIIFCALLFAVQSPYIWQFEIIGEETLSKTEIVNFIKENFSNNKFKLSTKKVEGALYDEYDEISFVSVIVRGQTLVVNIKEKLLPDEIFGDFEPVVSEYDGKVTGVNLISGTMAVQTGDYVKAGDVLVYPYYDDAGTIKQVMAKAEITMEIYHTATVTHFTDRVELERTGNSVTTTEILLFNLPIYVNENVADFSLYEKVEEERDLIENNILPLKLRRTTIYELEEKVIHETFEEAQERLIEEARENALKNADGCDIIVDEYYTVEKFDSYTKLNYCIVEEIKVVTNEN